MLVIQMLLPGLLVFLLRAEPSGRNEAQGYFAADNIKGIHPGERIPFIMLIHNGILACKSYVQNRTISQLRPL